MAISETNIKNAALSLIGAPLIITPTEDSKGAKTSKELYPLAVREVYEYPLIDWSFAISRAKLSRLADAPVFGSYDYQYALPARCLRVVSLCDEKGDETEYEGSREVYVDANSREYDVLLTNQDEAFVRYIRERSDTNSWPAYFAKMVYTRLAILLCAPLKADKQKKQQLLELWKEAIIEAKTGNGCEDVDVSDDNVPLDKGNTDVVKAAIDKKIPRRYIQVRSI